MPDIRTEWPPNIDDIRAVLPVTEHNIFSWDGIIYNPSGADLGPELIAHEAVHFDQQAGNPWKWWKQYLQSPEFRLEQELPAHRAEYREFCRTHNDRNARSLFLRHLVIRISAPMYGGLITAKEAGRRIKEIRK